MSDWEKLKVTELKEELKSRGIPLTGLKLKQQLIDKLVELDSEATSNNAPIETVTNGASEEVDNAGDKKPETDETTNLQPPEKSVEEETEPKTNAEDEKDDTILSSARPTVLKKEDSKAEEEDVDEGDMTTEDVPMAKTTEEVQNIKQNDMMIPQQEQLQVDNPTETNVDIKPQPDQKPETSPSPDHAKQKPEADMAQPEEPTKLMDHETHEPVQHNDDEIKEDLRKRKRRSLTPVPTADEIQKKAKGTSGEAIVTKRASPPAEKSRSRSQSSVSVPRTAPENHDLPNKIQETQKQSHSPTEEQPPVSGDDYDAEPAIHNATKSLYIRNFKRPLHIPTLRSHISTVARVRSADADEDPVKFFYLDSIRTHAFVTFSNIAAASRVRNAMHNTRFPEEPQREPLWIDFIPDEQVQGWVDQESGSSGAGGAFGRGGTGKGKFEVVYSSSGDGKMYASLQEVDSSISQQKRPSFDMFSNGADRANSFSQERNQSSSADPSRTASAATGVHPDRARMIPKSPALERRPPPPSPRLRDERSRESKHEARREDDTPAFNALSSLFSSTKAKPLLYYKLPSQSVIDERLDMLRTLNPQRGVSGEPGMKRYTFEKVRGQEEWVDNGPEFGHGKKGMDRLFGAPRGGFRGGRGGGNPRGRFGMGDSYRGGGAR